MWYLVAYLFVKYRNTPPTILTIRCDCKYGLGIMPQANGTDSFRVQKDLSVEEQSHFRITNLIETIYVYAKRSVCVAMETTKWSYRNSYGHSLKCNC